MSDYIFVHNGTQHTPDGVVRVPDAAAHNETLQATELSAWAGKPDRWVGYVAAIDPAGHARPWRGMAVQITTWLGEVIGNGRITSISTFNGQRIVHLQVVTGWGTGALIRVTIRYDDQCRNGHNSFAITGGVSIPGKWDSAAGGFTEHFPSLAPLIKWHLCSSDGPMHYEANTIFHAGDRDHYGLRKGEIRQIHNGKTGLLAWELVKVDAAGARIKDTDLPAQYLDSAQPPADPGVRLAYVPWNQVGEGKDRQPGSRQILRGMAGGNRRAAAGGTRGVEENTGRTAAGVACGVSIGNRERGAAVGTIGHSLSTNRKTTGWNL